MNVSHEYVNYCFWLLAAMKCNFCYSVLPCYLKMHPLFRENIIALLKMWINRQKLMKILSKSQY